MNLIDRLKKNNSCIDGLAYCENLSLREAWDNCERGDWMLWASRKCVDLKVLTAAKVKCARLAQHLLTDQRSIDALDVAEKFSKGEATRRDLDAAAAAADAAADAAAAYAADADAYAAAAYDAAYTAAYAAYAAAAANANAAYAARNETLKKCADICRDTIPFELIEKYWGEK